MPLLKGSKWLLALIAAYVLTGGAWLLANPVAAAPDEPQQYLKTIALGRGDWFGSQSSQLMLNTRTPVAIAPPRS